IGDSALGFYARGYSLASLVQSVLGGAIQAVAAPVFARIRNDRSKIGYGIDFAVGGAIRVASGLYVFLALTASDVIHMVYGPMWNDAVPIVQMILPFAVLTSAQYSLQQIVLIVGSPRILAKIQFIQLSILILILWPVLHYWGVIGVSGAVSFTAVIGTVAFLTALKKYADFSVLSVLLRPLIGALFGAFILLVGTSVLELEELSRVVRVAFQLAMYGVGFVASVMIFDRSFTMDVIGKFKDAVRPVKN
ncbi:oligosaccharide flippase family protein, partial [Dehalococcoides mccartyi]|nr:oligosaccharide flippase family protein [Dehalococcoides mccartyi]